MKNVNHALSRVGLITPRVFGQFYRSLRRTQPFGGEDSRARLAKRVLDRAPLDQIAFGRDGGARSISIRPREQESFWATHFKTPYKLNPHEKEANARLKTTCEGSWWAGSSAMKSCRWGKWCLAPAGTRSSG
jgi:hypothetical protein